MTRSRAARLAGSALLAAAAAVLLVLWARQTAALRALERAASAPVGSDAALAEFDRSVALGSGDPLTRALRSGALLARGDFEGADADARAAAVSYDSPPFALQRASITRRLGRDAESVSLLERARLMDPDSVETLTQLAATLYALGRYEEASRVATEFVERHPDNVDALYLQGACAEALGRPAQARVCYLQVQDLLERGAKSALKIAADDADDRLRSD